MGVGVFSRKNLGTISRATLPCHCRRAGLSAAKPATGLFTLGSYSLVAEKRKKKYIYKKHIYAHIYLFFLLMFLPHTVFGVRILHPCLVATRPTLILILILIVLLQEPVRLCFRFLSLFSEIKHSLYICSGCASLSNLFLVNPFLFFFYFKCFGRGFSFPGRKSLIGINIKRKNGKRPLDY